MSCTGVGVGWQGAKGRVRRVEVTVLGCTWPVSFGCSPKLLVCDRELMRAIARSVPLSPFAGKNLRNLAKEKAPG